VSPAVPVWQRDNFIELTDDSEDEDDNKRRAAASSSTSSGTSSTSASASFRRQEPVAVWKGYIWNKADTIKVVGFPAVRAGLGEAIGTRSAGISEEVIRQLQSVLPDQLLMDKIRPKVSLDPRYRRALMAPCLDVATPRPTGGGSSSFS
jgi:hypothetical protein